MCEEELILPMMYEGVWPHAELLLVAARLAARGTHYISVRPNACATKLPLRQVEAAWLAGPLATTYLKKYGSQPQAVERT
jgi:hypothetical protein